MSLFITGTNKTTGLVRRQGHMTINGWIPTSTIQQTDIIRTIESIDTLRTMVTANRLVTIIQRTWIVIITTMIGIHATNEWITRDILANAGLRTGSID
jgi:hypothetical protein